MMEFFDSLGVDMEISDMSFSVSLDKGLGCEWGSRNGLSSLFAQKKNLFNPYFWQMIHEIVKFKNDVLRSLTIFSAAFFYQAYIITFFCSNFSLTNCSYVEELENNPDLDRNETLGQFMKSRGYSELFQKAYLVRLLKHFIFSYACSLLFLLYKVL